MKYLILLGISIGLCACNQFDVTGSLSYGGATAKLGKTADGRTVLALDVDGKQVVKTLDQRTNGNQ